MVFDLGPACDSIEAELTSRGLGGTQFQISVDVSCEGSARAACVAASVAVAGFPHCMAETADAVVMLVRTALEDRGYGVVPPATPQPITVTTP